MSNLTLGWHVAAGLMTMLVPVAITALILVGGAKLMTEFYIKEPFGVFIMAVAVILTAALSSGWLLVVTRECGLLATHFPITEEDREWCSGRIAPE